MSLTWYRKTIGLFSSASRRGQRPRRRPRLLLGLEPLEGRLLPAIGTPIWVDQGPSSTGNPAPGINFAATSQLQQNVGAIQAVAVNPFNANQVWVATADGGIWRTTNATAASPNWSTTTVTFSAPNGPGGTQATGTVNVTGQVTGVVIANGGSGYNNAAPPNVTFSAPDLSGGTQATGTATVDNTGRVTGVTITNPGSGYTATPTVTFGAPGAGGTTATGTATLTVGVTGVVITNGGSGYTSATVTFSAPTDSTGTTATGTAVVNNGRVTGVTITKAGSGYTMLTDQLPFLGMGDIALSPLDSNNKPITAATPLNQLVLYAGNARVSSSFQQGAAPAGLYKSTNGGATWTLISGTTFQNASIYSVVPTSIVDQVSKGQVVLVATDQGIAGGSTGTDQNPTNPLGLYRSADGGTTWVRITNGLPAGGVRQVVADPANPNRFYAAISGQGVFRSDDGGVSWKQTTNAQLTGTGNTTVDKTRRIELAVTAGTTATGFANINDTGGVTGVVITKAGSYTTAPTVTFSAPVAGGTTATGTATIDGTGRVTGVVITNAGSGYNAAPTVTFSAPPNNNVVYAGLIGNGGNQGYNILPTVTFSAPNTPGGTTATGTAVVNNGRVTGVTMINRGSGYTTPPTVTFSAPNTPGGIQATGVASIGSNGQVTGVTILGDGNLIGLFRSTNQGTTWASMGVPQDANGPILTNQGNLNLSLLADPNNPTVVFVGGQSQVNAQVTGTWSGRHLRGQFDAATGKTTWTSLDGMAPRNAVHADSRNMVFDPNGNILEVNDGGIYRLSNPNGAAPTWSSVNGDLRDIEFASIAYDSVNGIVFGGAQDNGTPQQNSPGNRTWTDLSTGDGMIVQVDNTSLPGESIHYSSAQNLGTFYRRVYDNANNLVSTTPVGLNVFTGTDRNGRAILRPLREIDTIPFTTPWVLNAVDPTRMLLGTTTLYESFNRGDTLFPQNGMTNIGTISALAYGGRLNGVANLDVAYVGTGGFFDQQGGLFLRDSAGGNFNRLTNYTGGTPTSIALDPDNWQVAYIVDNQGRVWRTVNAGQTFTNITGNLTTLLTSLKEGPMQYGSVTLFANTSAPNDEVVFVGGPGGVYATDNPGAANGNAQWVRFDAQQVANRTLPNVLVLNVRYDPASNVLVAGTFGRGAWTVADLSNFVGQQAPVVSNVPNSTFNEGAGELQLAPNLTVADADDANLSSAQVTITNVRDGQSEVLAANTTGTNIKATYAVQGTIGVLTLTGTDTLAHYQQVLRTVTYNDTAAPMNPVTRRITFVVNDGAVNSDPAVSLVTIIPLPARPALALSGAGPDAAAVFNQAEGPVVLAPAAVITDPSSSTLSSARVTITNLVDGGSEVLTADTTGTGITASYDPSTGVLTLSGTDTLAHYQQVLRTVTYSDDRPGALAEERVVTVEVNDGTRRSADQLVSVEVLQVNNAPVLDATGKFQLPAINLNDFNNQGSEVFELLASAGPGTITDPDLDALGGMAVVGVDDSHGAWQWSDDGGQTWQIFDNPSVTNATLLPDDFDVRVRFVPVAGFSGTAALQFRAWDQTVGAPGIFTPETTGLFADTSMSGGFTSFSSAFGTVAVTVNAPVSPPPTPPPPAPPPTTPPTTPPAMPPSGCPARTLSVLEQAFLDLGLVQFLDQNGFPVQQQFEALVRLGLLQNPLNVVPLAVDDLSLITDLVISDLHLGPALQISAPDLNQQIASLECEINDLIHGTTS